MAEDGKKGGVPDFIKPITVNEPSPPAVPPCKAAAPAVAGAAFPIADAPPPALNATVVSCQPKGDGFQMIVHVGRHTLGAFVPIEVDVGSNGEQTAINRTRPGLPEQPLNERGVFSDTEVAAAHEAVLRYRVEHGMT